MKGIRFYTVTVAARMLGLKPNSLRKWALRHGMGIQPGGRGTPRYFTMDMIDEIRDRDYKKRRVTEQEDCKAMGFDPYEKWRKN